MHAFERKVFTIEEITSLAVVSFSAEDGTPNPVPRLDGQEAHHVVGLANEDHLPVELALVFIRQYGPNLYWAIRRRDRTKPHDASIGRVYEVWIPFTHSDQSAAAFRLMRKLQEPRIIEVKLPEP